MSVSVAVPRSDASGDAPGQAANSGEHDRTPISSPGAGPETPERTPVERKVTPRRPGRRDSEPPFRKLTPYHARLDVEMDDTAVSKVRDPSASLRLGTKKGRVRSQEAVVATLAGAFLGALLVGAVAIVLRACAASNDETNRAPAIPLPSASP
jgi:hypothetical protein